MDFEKVQIARLELGQAELVYTVLLQQKQECEEAKKQFEEKLENYRKLLES